MEVLETNPIKNKRVYMHLIKDGNEVLNENEKTNLIELLKSHRFDFATIDIINGDFTKVINKSTLDVLKKFEVPCFYLDIPEYVKFFFLKYLISEVSRLEEEIEELELEYKPIKIHPKLMNTFKAKNIRTWIRILKQELRENERFLNITFRNQWIVKGLREIIEFSKEKKLFVLHFTSVEDIFDFKAILEDIEINVVIHNLKEKLHSPNQIIKKNLGQEALI